MMWVVWCWSLVLVPTSSAGLRHPTHTTRQNQKNNLSWIPLALKDKAARLDTLV